MRDQGCLLPHQDKVSAIPTPGVLRFLVSLPQDRWLRRTVASLEALLTVLERGGAVGEWEQRRPTKGEIAIRRSCSKRSGLLAN
jgi:hypothetical protein